jgi:hypothetical protein
VVSALSVVMAVISNDLSTVELGLAKTLIHDPCNGRCVTSHSAAGRQLAGRVRGGDGLARAPHPTPYHTADTKPLPLPPCALRRSGRQCGRKAPPCDRT